MFIVWILTQFGFSLVSVLFRRVPTDAGKSPFFHLPNLFAPRRLKWTEPAAMVSRKRTHSEVDAAPEQQPSGEPGLLHRLRNCWEFANLMQFISMFGKIMKIDEDFGIEVCICIYIPGRLMLCTFARDD